MIIGITGGIGSGKTAATEILALQGITIVDADICARLVVQPDSPTLLAIQQHFGPDILLPNGELNRAHLRTLIFSSSDEKAWLENLMHPQIRAEITSQLTASQSEYTVLVSPLLLETDQHLLCDQIIVIDANEHNQIIRTCHRDNNSEQQVKAIISTQLSRQERIDKADIVVENNDTREAFEQRVLQIHQTLLKVAQND